MNAYTFNEITVGQKESFSAEITAGSLAAFKNLTGDCNPLHTDADFAKAKGYEGVVCYGMLTASFLSTLAGMFLPGKNSVIYEVETKFIKPVVFKTGQAVHNLTVSGEVIEKNDSFRRIVIKAVITDSDDAKVLRAVMKVGVSE